MVQLVISVSRRQWCDPARRGQTNDIKWIAEPHSNQRTQGVEVEVRNVVDPSPSPASDHSSRCRHRSRSLFPSPDKASRSEPLSELLNVSGGGRVARESNISQKRGLHHASHVIDKFDSYVACHIFFLVH
jgi:hypothetical protein